MRYILDRTGCRGDKGYDVIYKRLGGTKNRRSLEVSKNQDGKKTGKK